MKKWHGLVFALLLLVAVAGAQALIGNSECSVESASAAAVGGGYILENPAKARALGYTLEEPAKARALDSGYVLEEPAKARALDYVVEEPAKARALNY